MILLIVQFWQGDREQAMELARLIADIEPAYRENVQILFAARFDCKHDDAAIEYVSHKFRVHKMNCKRKAVGWPNGPNQMAGESYEYVVEGLRNKKLDQAIDAVMLIEADCIPLHKNWITMLYDEFKASNKLVSGAWLKKADAGIEHVNGNLIMSTRFWKVCPEIFHPQSRGGWDATLANRIMPYAHPSRLIWSDYQLGQPHNPWRGCDYLWAPKRYSAKNNALYGQDLYPVWFHGIKTPKGLECARNRLLGYTQDAKHKDY
jgi:hypothetical protein